MKSSLDHLPPGKRRELDHIKTVLMSEFEIAIAGGTQPWRRNGRILKIILFGSFGRGDWVEDRSSGYKSDWDLLIIVNHENLTVTEDYWSVAEDKLLRDPKVKRVVNVIVHTLADVNDALAKGKYFWVAFSATACCSMSFPAVRSRRRSRSRRPTLMKWRRGISTAILVRSRNGFDLWKSLATR